MNGELTVSVAQQASVLLYAAAAGFAMGMYYDFFRAVRIIIPCGKTAVMLQDVFFWLTSAAAVFFVSIAVNGGYLRVYFVAAVLMAWVLYFFTMGHVTMFIVNIAVLGVKRLISLVFSYVMRPVSQVANRFFMLISQKISDLLTYMTKNTKNHKKC